MRLRAALALWFMGACYDAPVETPPPKVSQELDVNVRPPKDKVDILFMIDNSPSMAPKQAELKARFPELIEILDELGQRQPVSYHVGVVTSDLGAGAFTLGGGQCRPGGDGGKLQAVGAAADPSCIAPTGAAFIDYDQIHGQSNLPPGQDLATTFGCMASVGDQGCGFEMQLESVYRALHDPIATNQGFLRDDAILVVVLVTDEDDCSADPGTDLFDPSKSQLPPAGYGPLLSYRCTNFSIACPSLSTPGNLLPYADSGGNQAPCQDADPSVNKLIPVGKYIDFFHTIKPDPGDVLLVDITAPDGDVESILAHPSTVPPGPYQTCSPLDTGGNPPCDVVLQHSCVSAQDPQFFGDPAVRIRQVVSRALNQQSTSICDTSYQSALKGIGDLIHHALDPCIGSPFADPMNPDCVVEDVTGSADSPSSVSTIPRCDQAYGALPCWRLESKAQCTPVCLHAGDPGQQYGVTIDRPPSGVPPHTSARVACATLAITPDPQTGMLPLCGPPM
jgi:hypothetical protein